MNNKSTLLSICNITILFIMILFISCSYIDDSLKTEKEYATISDYKYFGEFHNILLDNVKNNFPDSKILTNYIKTKEDGIDYVVKFNQEFIARTNIPSQFKKDELIKSFSYFRNLLNYEVISQSVSNISNFRRKNQTKEYKISSNDTTLSIQDIKMCRSHLEQIYHKNYITKDAYSILDELYDLIYRNYQGIISDQVFELKIDNLIAKVDKSHYKIGDKTIEIVGPVLSISQYSLDWWTDNPDAMVTNGKLAPWVAMDIIGAIDGIVCYALCTSDTDCNWKDAGKNALIGGGVASIGGTSKIFNLLRKL